MNFELGTSSKLAPAGGREETLKIIAEKMNNNQFTE